MWESKPACWAAKVPLPLPSSTNNVHATRRRQNNPILTGEAGVGNRRIAGIEGEFEGVAAQPAPDIGLAEARYGALLLGHVRHRAHRGPSPGSASGRWSAPEGSP